MRLSGGLNPVLEFAAKPDQVIYHRPRFARLALLVAFRSHNPVLGAFIFTRMSVR